MRNFLKIWLLVIFATMTLARPDDVDKVHRVEPVRSLAENSSTRGKNRADDGKSNPELDWRTTLKKLAEKEERKKKYDLDFMFDKLESTPNLIQWLVDLYFPLRWKKIPGEPNDMCRTQMEDYLSQLRNGTGWAMKMADASGKYSSHYHFGNGFWLGSRILCRELNDTLIPQKSYNGHFAFNDSLPFPLSFYVVRMLLTLPSDIETSARQVFLGLCLPNSCDHSSVNSIIRACADRVEREGEATHQAEGPRINIVQVRSVPSTDYEPQKDPKFQLIASLTGIIAFLMVWAVIYDYQNFTRDSDVELSISISNNNDQRTFVDKHFEEQGTSVCRDNDKDFMEKLDNGKKLAMAMHARSKIIREQGLPARCLQAFNPITNAGKIISTEPAAKNNLTCLHGLRVLSLAWVILVHTYLQVFSIAENKNLRSVTERNVMFQTVSNATFSVDTFFCISGLLMTIIFYRSVDKSNPAKGNFALVSSKKFLLLVFYRFMRLTPSYLFVLGVNLIAMKYAMSTTVFRPQIIDHLTCERFWWRNALYVNSLFPRAEMCMLWSWYMANDMQFYVLGVFILLLSVKYLRAAVFLLIILLLSSFITTFSIAYSHDYIARIQEPFALFDELYDKPWLRAGPFFVGMITGYLLHTSNGLLKMPSIFRCLGWVCSLTTMCLLVYGLYPNNLSVTTSSLYASLGHTAWTISISFIVVQCCTGSAPHIDKLLSLRLIHPLSRLTYCAYLVHPMIMMIISTQMDGPLHLYNGIIMIIYFGNFVVSYLVAFCVSITFEAPIVNLLKIMTSPKERVR